MKSNFYSSARVLVLAVFSMVAGCFTKVNAQQFLTTIDGWNAYVHLPDEYYDSVGKTYPLICFVPGTGECGTNAALLLSYGPSKYVAAGHNMQFTVNGKIEKPIVISLQPSSLWPSAYTMNRKLDSIFARYRCDQQRVHATGLSMGGWSWDNYVDNYSPAYTSRITSIVSLSAPEPDNGIGNMRYFALAGGTAWFFEGNMDLRGNDKIRDTMNNHVRSSARYTMYTGGHCCWNTFYNPTWTDNGESIYTWMLKQRKTLITGPVAPEANAGNDSTITNILVNYSLNGYGNDPNGLPVNFSWTKVQGPAGGLIAAPTVLQTGITGLMMGIYKYELKVTNALGMVAKDTLTINNGFGVLPVVLTDFSAKAKDKSSVLVQWSTSSEINCDYFMVEKSNDAQNFSEGMRITSRGTGSLGTPYYFTDNYPENGLNYYRLKMVDRDGKISYSDVVSVLMKREKMNSIAIAAAFASDNQVQLKLNSLAVQPANLSIVDANGKKLYTINLSLNKGLNNINRNIYLSRGVYYVNVNSGNENITKAFIRE